MTFEDVPHPPQQGDYYRKSVMGPPPLSVQKKILFQWLRVVAKRFNFGDFKWGLEFAVRHELGEATERPHFHALLAGFKNLPNVHTAGFQLSHLWETGCGKSAGFCQVRSYDTRRSGVEYIMKAASGWSLEGANAYELAKYALSHDSETLPLILAPCVYRTLFNRERRRGSRNQGSQNARFKKLFGRDRSSRGGSPKHWTPATFCHPAAPVGTV